MLRSLPSAIDDALGTLYKPNAVCSQFLGSASMTFFLFFLLFFFLSSFFLSLLPLLVFSCFSCLFRFFSFLFLFFVLFRFLLFSFLSFIIFSFLCFFSPIGLRLSCVCVVIDTTCDMRRMHRYGPGTS